MSIGTIERWPFIAVPRSLTSSCRTVLTMRNGLSSAPALMVVHFIVRAKRTLFIDSHRVKQLMITTYCIAKKIKKNPKLLHIKVTQRGIPSPDFFHSQFL